jgi:hypothetical protein
METKEEEKMGINYNGYFAEGLVTYDIKSINELEDGTLFGLITNKAYVDVIYPEYSCNKGDYNNYIKSIDEDVFSNIGFVSKIYSSGNDIPLIFKKVGQNLAKELISGETFLIASDSEELIGNPNYTRDMNKFQEDIDKYSKNNVVLLNLAKSYIDGTKPAIFTVNDAFKVLYYDDAYLVKEEILKNLQTLKAHANSYFKNKMDAIIEQTAEVAYIDNFLYDIEHSTKKLTRN